MKHYVSFCRVKNNRDYGIDLLRMIAMYMVVILHCIGHGGVIEGTVDFSVNYWVIWFLRIAAYGAVDIYALISGYVGFQSKHRLASFGELWLRVLFYSVSLTVIAKLFIDSNIGIGSLVFSFFPVTKGGLWYFTLYTALFFLRPVLNAAVQTFSRKNLRNVVVASVLLFTVLAFLWASDVFKLNDGYSLAWLIVLYLTGAYIGKYHVFSKIKKPIAVFGYLGSVTVVWCSKFFIQNYFPSLHGIQNKTDWLINYTSLPVFLSALFLLLLFRNLNLPIIMKRIIAVFSPLAFSVYVIHDGNIIRPYFIQDRFVVYGSYSPAVMVLSVLGIAAGIYLICSVVDFFRESFFQILNVKEKLSRLENRIFPAQDNYVSSQNSLKES